MLKAQGDFILPDNVPANEFLNLESNKISTSRNCGSTNTCWTSPASRTCCAMCRSANAPETKDNDFTWKDFQARNNNELVGNLGTLSTGCSQFGMYLYLWWN